MSHREKAGREPGHFLRATTCKLSNSRQIEAARAYRELKKAAKAI
jgi:hypothetical protein